MSLDKLALQVQAGHHDRLHCPVSVNVGGRVPPGRGLRLTEAETGAPVAATLCGACCACDPVLTFILDELPAGGTRQYVAELTEGGCCAAEAAGGVEVTAVPGDRVDFAIGGKAFTSYVTRAGIARPFCYPVYGPGGVEMTNCGPADHVHHRSMYIAQGEVNGCDNWSELEGHARTVNKSVSVLTQGAMGAIQATADWVGRSGQPILEERVCLCTYALPEGVRLLDWDITWAAVYGGVFFGDTKEAGTLSVRVNEQLEGRHAGRITNAYGGVTESETWGKRAPWCDYSGEVDGRRVGLAIFDHPDNFRYPTWWHVRDYGLFTANQWGLHDFTGDWSQRGDHALPAGQSLRFRFRVYIHGGDVADARVGDRFHDWAHPPTVAFV